MAKISSLYVKEQARPIAAHRPTLSKRELESVLDCLIADQISQGQITRRFERAFSSTFSYPHVLALNSSAAAYHLAFLGLGLGSNDHVLLSALSSEAACDAARYTGSAVHLADIEKNSFHPSLETISALIKKIQSQSKNGENQKIAYAADHSFGAPLPYDLLEVRSMGVSIVEDFTGLAGSDQEGAYFGKAGDYSVCGLSERDLLTTGNGAVLITGHSQLYKSAYNRRYGAKREAHSLAYDYRLEDFQTAMGLVQLSHLGMTLSRRKKIGRCYLENLQRTKHETYFKNPSVDSYLRFPVFIQKDSDEIKRYFRSLQIGISPIVDIPLHRLLGLSPLQFPNAERLFRRSVCLPLYPSLGSVSIERICSAVRGIV